MIHRRSAPGHGRTARPGAAWLVLALVLALLGQSFLAQTHHHFDTNPVATAPAHPAPAESDHHGPADPSSDCPICLGLSHLGAYLTPPVQTLPIVLAVVYRAFLPPALPFVWKRRYLLPRSRAPPPGFLS